MVSITRGRGWSQNEKDPLPKPGSSCPEDINYINLVNIISLVNDQNLKQKVEEATNLIHDKINKTNLKEMHEKLYKHALSDKEFGIKLLRVYHSPMFQKICDSENTSLYKYLVNYFQSDYKRRKNLRQESITHFHNAICLFSEFMSYVNDKNSDFLKTLQSALLDYMEMLLETASAEDIKIFAEQFVMHGKYFHSSYKEKVDNLMIIARQILINKNLSPEFRQTLLYIIDLENRNFSTLPNNLQKLYKSQLENNFVQGDSNVTTHSLTIMEDELSASKEELSNQKQQSMSANNRRLRAIRGAVVRDIESSKDFITCIK